jgi:hypothetical protein
LLATSAFHHGTQSDGQNRIKIEADGLFELLHTIGLFTDGQPSDSRPNTSLEKVEGNQQAGHMRPIEGQPSNAMSSE